MEQWYFQFTTRKFPKGFYLDIKREHNEFGSFYELIGVVVDYDLAMGRALSEEEVDEAFATAYFINEIYEQFVIGKYVIG